MRIFISRKDAIFIARVLRQLCKESHPIGWEEKSINARGIEVITELADKLDGAK